MTAATRLTHRAPRAGIPAAVTAGPLLEVRNLAGRFGPIQALSGGSLTVAEGEGVAPAGENGAGKTTPVRCIGGRITPSNAGNPHRGAPVPAQPAAPAPP